MDRTYCTELHPKQHIAAGKLANPGVQGQPPEGEKNKAHSSNLHVCVSPITPTGCYCLSGVVNGVETSLLLDTGQLLLC